MNRSTKIKTAGFALMAAGLISPLLPNTKNKTFQLFRETAMYSCDAVAALLIGKGYAIQAGEEIEEAVKPNTGDQRYLLK